MAQAFVALGSNLDDPRAQVLRGFDALDALPQTRVVARSHLYRTPPWGLREQPDFINAAAELDTRLAPVELLTSLQHLETMAGRVRGVANGPRTLDLDLLLYGDDVIDAPGLSVPHPRLAGRAFVLVPLAELAPALDIPGFGRVSELLMRVDASGCIRLD